MQLNNSPLYRIMHIIISTYQFLPDRFVKMKTAFNNAAGRWWVWEYHTNLKKCKLAQSF